MFKQMDIFDFIEKPQEPAEPEFKSSMLERLFGKINSPVAQCANCLCERCVNNVEELWSKVGPEEQKKPCFNCDECRCYTGEFRHRLQKKEDCKDFIISEYAAKRKRKKIKMVDISVK